MDPGGLVDRATAAGNLSPKSLSLLSTHQPEQIEETNSRTHQGLAPKASRFMLNTRSKPNTRFKEGSMDKGEAQAHAHIHMYIYQQTNMYKQYLFSLAACALIVAGR